MPARHALGERVMDIDTEELRVVPGGEIMRLLGTSPKRLRKLEADPELCFPKKIIINGRVFYRFVEMRNWLTDMQVQSEHIKLVFPKMKVSAAE